jgi:hypothetical protein
MPGSRVPIRGGAALKDIDICLLSLNPESERKVVAKQQGFRRAVGNSCRYLLLIRIRFTATAPNETAQDQ